MKIFYAGIGSRETPPRMLQAMTQIGNHLAQAGLVLRSGAAPGADQAFERGCDQANGEKQIFIPWAGFCGREHQEGTYIGASSDALKLTEQYHPNWAACTQGARLLHARNAHQVLGKHLDEHAKFVICWTKGGTGAGGTGQAIRIAKAFNIPVFDLGKENVLADLDTYMQTLED